MRVNEWADEFWVRTIAPAALGFRINIMSSAGVAHDRLYRPLPPWVPNSSLCLQRGMTVGHAVVDGKGTHYFVVKLTNVAADNTSAAAEEAAEHAMAQQAVQKAEEQAMAKKTIAPYHMYVPCDVELVRQVFVKVSDARCMDVPHACSKQVQKLATRKM